MQIDFSAITEYQRYKLMVSLIVPRPIALITTLSEDGVVNAAPSSMFNMLDEDPPHRDGQHQPAEGRRAQAHGSQHRANRRVCGAPE